MNKKWTIITMILLVFVLLTGIFVGATLTNTTNKVELEKQAATKEDFSEFLKNSSIANHDDSLFLQCHTRIQDTGLIVV